MGGGVSQERGKRARGSGKLKIFKLSLPVPTSWMDGRRRGFGFSGDKGA